MQEKAELYEKRVAKLEATTRGEDNDPSVPLPVLFTPTSPTSAPKRKPVRLLQLRTPTIRSFQVVWRPRVTRRLLGSARLSRSGSSSRCVTWDSNSTYHPSCFA